MNSEDQKLVLHFEEDDVSNDLQVWTQSFTPSRPSSYAWAPTLTQGSHISMGSLPQSWPWPFCTTPI